MNNTNQLIFAASNDGAIHVFETASVQELFEQRVVWCEPLPTRLVEGYEKFYCWRREYGLDVSDKSPEMHFNSIDCKRISTLLAKFASSLHSLRGNCQSIAVDDASGLVLVDCTVASGSICIYEPVSLRRLYRVQSPCKVSNEIEKAIQSISTGGKGYPDLSQLPDNCMDHLIAGMKVVAARSLLLCMFHNNRIIQILSLLTGEKIMDVVGHFSSISCVTLSLQFDMIFTGSLDASIRLWRMSELLPLKYANIVSSSQTSSDSSLILAETKVVQIGASTNINVQAIKSFYTQLCLKLKVRNRWMVGKVIGFSDGKSSSHRVLIDKSPVGVEVVFEDLTVQMFENRVLLRDLGEVGLAPDGPPLWSNKSALIEVGRPVAVFASDIDSVSLTLARNLGRSLNDDIIVEQLAEELALTMLSNLNEDSELSMKREREKSTILSVLFMLGYERNDRIKLVVFIRLLRRHQDRVHSVCERYLHSHRAPITSIALSDTTKLLVSLDRRYSVVLLY